MRKKNVQTIGDAIKLYLKAIGAEQKLKEIRTLNQWENIVGKNIANVTTELYIKDRILYVAIKSSIIRSELYMSKTLLLHKINTFAQTDLIKDIVFL